MRGDYNKETSTYWNITVIETYNYNLILSHNLAIESIDTTPTTNFILLGNFV